MPRRRPGKPEKQLTRKQLSRREQEARTRRWLIIGTGTVIALVVLILGWGLYEQYVLRPRRPVATVYGTPISLGAYQKMVHFRRWDSRNRLDRLESQKVQLGTSNEDQSFLIQYIDQQIQQMQGQLLNLPTTVLDEMIDDALVRHEATQRGIVVTPEEVELELEQQFGYERNPPTPAPTPTTDTASLTDTVPITVTPPPTVAPMTEQEFTEQSKQWFTAMQEGSGFSEEEFRRLLETSLYYRKVNEAIGAEVPTTAEQVHARHILVQTAEEAQAVLDRLSNGEDFAALAAELSQDTSNKDDGGDLGWFTRGQMDPAFEEAAFALQPGQTSEAVQSSYGFHIIRVEERAADRPLEPDALSSAQNQAVSDWFAAQRTSPEVVRSWDSSMIPPERSTR